MKIKEINISIGIKKITNDDTLFLGNYIIDPYQNCSFGCCYCDSTFDDTICVKQNIIEIIEEEIKNLKPGRIIIGSVHEPYQIIEKEYQLTRQVLEIIRTYDFPIHIITKSDLVLRDLDLLNSYNDVLVTFSLITTDVVVSRLIEKNVLGPIKRLETMKVLIDKGIISGVALIPIIPFITDKHLQEILHYISDYNARYVLFKHLFLRGDQKIIFFNFIRKHFPKLINEYETIYTDHFLPSNKYMQEINKEINRICKKYNLRTNLKNIKEKIG